tara:strand:- start:13072 stop:13671 length:600 start_codon:yes stop_codon:yes gene_type:complete
MKKRLAEERQPEETSAQALARHATTPESLSASVLTLTHKLNHSQLIEMVDELKQQSAAVHANDMSRAESMLMSQAHTLDGLFAKLASKALAAEQLSVMDPLMRLALKAQNQARATLQTLAELKTPKHIAFVKQANIGNQVQVNNGAVTTRTRTRKNQKVPNELLEVENGERMDTRAASAASNADPAMETLGTKHRPKQR